MFHLTASLLVSGTGETFRNITAGAASVATLLAVFIGGIWAWFKFIRGRTSQPRIAIELLGQWRAVVDDAQAPRSGLRRHRPKSHVLHVRVRVTNIGAGKVMLRQYYTALYVSFLRNRESALPALPSGRTIWRPSQTRAVPVPSKFSRNTTGLSRRRRSRTICCWTWADVPRSPSSSSTWLGTRRGGAGTGVGRLGDGCTVVFCIPGASCGISAAASINGANASP